MQEERETVSREGERGEGVEVGEITHGGILVSIIVIIHLGLFPACPPLRGLIALYTVAP